MASRHKVKQAFIEPGSTYDEPADVLADDNLSSAEKRRILENWERDARELAVAEDENMAGGEPDRLGAVLEALSQLPPEDERPRGPATMHGSQPAPTSKAQPQETRGTRISASDARQGEIILKTPLRRAIFVGGIVLAAVICVFLFYEATL